MLRRSASVRPESSLLCSLSIPHYLREQMGGKRLRSRDQQRRRLAAKAKKIGRNGLFRVETLVTPDTLLRGHRTLIARRYDGSNHRNPGRPRTADEIGGLVLSVGGSLGRVFRTSDNRQYGNQLRMRC
jgi:hypothetical protein